MSNWTDQEIATLTYWYPKESAEKLSIRLARSAVSIRQKARRLGIRKRKYKRSNIPQPLQITEWADTYTEIYPHACLLTKRGVPMEVRSLWMGGRGIDKREKFAIFRIYPRRGEHAQANS